MPYWAILLNFKKEEGKKVKRKRPLVLLLAFLLVAVSALAGCGSDSSSSSNRKTIRIGYQKGDPLHITKSLGELDKRLKEMGYKVEWKQFQDGSALIEALNAGSIDYGRTGDIPPITAQASGSKIVYVGAGHSKAKGSGILVPKNSSIKSISDLKGKKVAFSKGSSSHYLVVKALQKAGLSLKDITPVYLDPSEARIAFEKGNVDAWAVWDPYTASAQVNAGAKMLVSGEGLTTDRDFIIASKSYAESHKKVTDAVLEETEKAMEWANNHHSELVNKLAGELKMDKKTVQTAVERRVYGFSKISDTILKEQQSIADLFYELKVVPKKVNVQDAVLK
ncbi:sulfonate ABC transporter substrate-binding protein [Weizmannia coagulans]|uniref:Putative aliphatic sulfonates-binding protein n=1 Tax=Heyndrickxia coagulans TaxID=1398 RepID=A0AAW7CG83_HEYCO|nr:sulfonate ABC transporter substrate-binding protein [Heyndrickxia coagulans]MDL5039926.1 sulfonate ABC transporter substrate-binding protein [Heyndrickxia coagulans]MED4312768.1 sulfonate ABC transporter substrate-binding protein [Heyndrickxia coagulans]